MQQLSGGQKARVCFASITCRKPEILILDEPTNHLDIESVEALIDALKRYQGGLVLVSHDARLIQASGCDLWLCRAGQALTSVKSFEEYRRQVLKDLQRRQQLAEEEAKRRALQRQKRRVRTSVFGGVPERGSPSNAHRERFPMAPSLTLPSLAVDALGCFRGTGLVGWIFIGPNERSTAVADPFSDQMATAEQTLDRRQVHYQSAPLLPLATVHRGEEKEKMEMGDPVDQSVLDTRALQVFQHHLWQVPQIFGAVRSVGKTAKVAVGSR
ncbi:unnamed protein product [Durusdinium trenchii]|uniref:ABC transporter domain-containing protein n=1 Tax=Durusdinium trenchii TaxID=1381693 RepID=A0ABP0Q143_9DINO